MSSPSGSSSSSSSMAPWLLNACRSFTSLRAHQLTDTHLLRIEGYSTADRMAQQGESIESGTFKAAGHKWRLRFFPHASPGVATVVELELMKHRYNEDVVAAYELSVIDRYGNPGLSYTVGPQWFNKDSDYKHRVDVLTTPEAREAALRLSEGGQVLAVRCNLTVTRFDKESRLKWYLRKLLD